MIETLEAVHEATRTDPTPDSTKASVMLQGIFFASEIWKPLYPGLYDYGAVPSGINLVPSFQVKDPRITSVSVILELQEDQGFEFLHDQPDLFLHMIKGSLDSVTLSFATPKSCGLQIDLENLGEKVGVIQVRCRRAGQAGLSNRETIEGGLFLSIVNNPPGGGNSLGQLERTSPPPAWEILVTGTDAQERMKYNLFAGTVYTDPSIVSAGLEPEIAFRVQQTQSLAAGVALATDLIFLRKDGDPNEVALTMLTPSTEPGNLNVPFLINADNSTNVQGCYVQWTSPSVPGRLDYLVTSFSMDVHLVQPEVKKTLLSNNWNGKFDGDLLKLLADLGLLKKLLRLGRADPTIIDTPICTRINGAIVCSD